MLKYLLPIRLFSVKGKSMSPTLKPGSILLGSYYIKPKPGHVAVIKRQPKAIKRIKRIDKQKGVWVEGDNAAASTDSRQYGWLKFQDVDAIIFMKLL